MKKKNKRSKKSILKKGFGDKEFIFNIISLIFVICVALYYGGRSLYYYGDQNKKTVQTANTLNGLLLANNQVITSGDGLYRNNDGYYFKGNVQNNYVWFANRMFRVVSVSEKDTVKLVTNDLTTSFIYGDSSKYDNSNLRNWLTNTDVKLSGIYYNTIPGNTHFLVKTKFTIDSIKDNKIVTGSKEYSDFVTSVSLSDYNLAGGKNSYFNDGNAFYLIGASEDEEEVLYVDSDGSIQNCDPLEGFGVKAVITFKSNIEVSGGDGTVNNPYVINQGKNVNYIDSYVKLGDDLYKVYGVGDKILRMYKTTYVLDKNNYEYFIYSSKSSEFDLSDKTSIAYYLNNTYYNSLPYKEYLLDTTFFVGELSDDISHEYTNIFSNSVIAKVGLLNMFDYASCGEIGDYYYINPTSNVSDMKYIKHLGGVIEEYPSKTLGHQIPVITISSDILKAGLGTKDNPYVLG